MPFYAHSGNDAGVWHLLSDHLGGAANMAALFSHDRAWKEEVRLAGIFHDLGKYGDLFQERLKGREQGLDHWSPGAWVALTDYQSTQAALCIQGHHIGLQRGDRSSLCNLNPTQMVENHPLNLRLSGESAELKSRMAADGISPVLTDRLGRRQVYGPELMLETRLMFSALTDADYLDTEAHFQDDGKNEAHRLVAPMLHPEKALAAVLKQIAMISSRTEASDSLREVRKTLLGDALDSSVGPLGLYTFTAPTGSGKTLAMLAFALSHAKRHGLGRIVLAVPYLSILEQTAKVYRDIFDPEFGKGYVLEHHGLAGLKNDDDGDVESERLRRLQAENWDAPIVLTTNVQLLESMFANSPSACRKLHRLVGSIVLFDEAQTLPMSLAVPTLAALSQFISMTGSSVVFATATQPAYKNLDLQVQKAGGLGWSTKEAVASSASLFDKCRRVKPEWVVLNSKWNMERLAEEMSSTPQALCVVNIKRQALALLEIMKNIPGLVHLSTNLCASHRQVVLAEVRKRLKDGEPCRLVATQCVEAGVDIDFPVVLRSLAPLEAIAQAAGRCNREGRLDLGRLIVFELDEKGRPYPDETYHQAAETTRSLLVERQGELDLDHPDTFESYYRRLYDISRPESKNPDLQQAIEAGDFVEVARQYRIIKQDMVNVLVSYHAEDGLYEELVSVENSLGIDKAWMRRAQMIAVSCFRPPLGHPVWGLLKNARLRYKRVESQDWYLLNNLDGWSYDALTGLRLPERRDGPPVMIA